MWANQQRMPEGGVSAFLEMRVTLSNASFAIVFAVLWQQCMQSPGLYRRSSDLLRVALMTMLGVGVMTLLLGMYLGATHAHGPLTRVLAVFFVSAFSYEMARVLVTNPRLLCRMGRPEQVIILGQRPPGGEGMARTARSPPSQQEPAWLCRRSRSRGHAAGHCRPPAGAGLRTCRPTFFITRWTS